MREEVYTDMDDSLVKKTLSVSALAYLVFVIYGSLVPLELSYISFSEAINRFWHTPFLDLGIESRADWVANFLLFIPLTYLGMCFFVQKGTEKKPIVFSLVMMFSAGLLACGIEFTQLYFPQRTVSQNDIAAEALGGIVGVVLWLTYHDKLFDRLLSLLNHQQVSRQWFLALVGYLTLLVLYSVMPLDLTLSPVEIYHKWQDGRVVLMPFSSLPDHWGAAIYELLSDIVLWLPIPILWHYAHIQRLTRIALFIRMMALAFLLEFCQLFVYSRVSDVTDLLTAAIGLGASVLWLNYSQGDSDQHIQRRRHWYQQLAKFNVVGCFTWCLAMAMLFWYPFNFVVEPTSITAGLKQFFALPFLDYYYGTEFRALTEVFHKILFSFPLGVFLGMEAAKNTRLSARRMNIIVHSFMAMICLIIEMMQIFLVNKFASSTDFVLMLLGASLGYQLACYFLNRRYSLVESSPVADISDKPMKTSQRVLPVFYLNNISYLFVGMLALYFALLIAVNSLELPYNVVELLVADNVYIQLLGISCLFFWCFGFPLGRLLRSAQGNGLYTLDILKYFFIHLAITWLLVRCFIPTESIYDIIGSPTWGILAELEMPLRFACFFSIFSFLLFWCSAVLLTVLKVKYVYIHHNGLAWFYCMFLLPIAFAGVIMGAGTDNIIELLPDEGYSFRLFAILAYLAIVSFSGIGLSLLAYFPNKKVVVFTLLAILLSIPLAYGLLLMGTEHYIVKYEQVFSALQFLLSTSRDHYVTGNDIFWRFTAAHSVFIIMLVFSQYHLWLTVPKVAAKTH